MAEEQTIKGAVYRFGKMDAMMAFHVSRRLAPVMEGMVKAFRDVGDSAADPAEALAPVAKALASMPDEAAEYVIRNSLALVTREGAQGEWARVQNRAGGLMFDDIDMPTMLRLTFHVLQDSFSDFFSELQSLSPALKARAGAAKT